MRKRENWLFFFAALGAVAALVKILEYFGINYPSKTLQPSGVTVPIAQLTSGLIWAIGLFLFSIGLSIFGFYISNRRRKDLETEVLRLKTELEKTRNHLQESQEYGHEKERELALEKENSLRLSHLRFYEGRNDHARPSLYKVMQTAKTIWVATHTAGNIRNADLLKLPIQKLILLDPNGRALESLASIALDRDASAIRNEVTQSIAIAQRNKVDLRLFDGPLTAIMIGDPESISEGWIQIEPYFPWSSANDRPSICFRQRDYPESFARLVKTFSEMWTRQPVSLSPRFSVEPISDLIGRVSGASIEFTSVNLTARNVTATIIFVDNNGFEVQRLQQGWWLAESVDAVDFDLGETKRLSIAVKDLDKAEFHAKSRNGSLRAEVVVGSTALSVRVTLAGTEDSSKAFIEQYQFRLQIDHSGALRLLRRHEAGK